MEKPFYKIQAKLMGNHFELTAVHENELLAKKAVEAGVAEIKRIEALLSTFQESSETNAINRFAGIKPVTVSEEIFSLIERAQRISQVTDGAFDLSYGSLDKRFWNFDTTMQSLPNKQTASKSVALINYKNIVLNPVSSTVMLKEEGMRIGFGGIGKGYAADKAKQIMLKMGVHSGVVNASGDLSVWGNQPNGEPWTIGIANPNLSNTIFSYFQISNIAMATSGNYEKYAMINGKKYSHTINPRTGYPVEGIKSVTILTSFAELADAMATPVMILGVKAGLSLINQIDQMEVIIIDDNDQVFTSKNIHLKTEIDA
ncbi:MAG: FAD:protein FMN transferase [Sediminibacterium sp.]|nr:FAD:protein FMN transferase [Chitinophagaceae bacterium]